MTSASDTPTRPKVAVVTGQRDGLRAAVDEEAGHVDESIGAMRSRRPSAANTRAAKRRLPTSVPRSRAGSAPAGAMPAGR